MLTTDNSLILENMEKHLAIFPPDSSPILPPGSMVAQYPPRDFRSEAAVKGYSPSLTLTDEQALSMIRESLAVLDDYHGTGPSEELLSTLASRKYVFVSSYARIGVKPKFTNFSHAVFVRGSLGANYWHIYESIVHQNVHIHFNKTSNNLIITLAPNNDQRKRLLCRMKPWLRRATW